MSIDELQALCVSLKAERTRLEELNVKLRACNLNGHQRQISVNISDLGNVALTDCARDTGYRSQVIRGREMILLGVKKALAALVDQQAATVARIEQQIADARVSP